MTKNSLDKIDNKVETIDENSKYRVCIDMKASGSAQGGNYINLKGLKDFVESKESSGKNRVVGFVYDGTDRIEVMTQNIEENTGVQSTIEEAKQVD